MVKDFLPISKKDMKKRGWEQCDFVYVIGDAYVDHSSFGPAIISRLLEAFGYKVGIIAQPDWKDKTSIMEFGEPRLGFLVSSGNIKTLSPCLVHRGWDFWYLRAIWIPWSTTTQYPKSTAKPILFHRAVLWADDRIMRRWCTAT